jgi:hypothetical protein
VLEPEFLDPTPQRIGVQLEYFGGSFWSFDDASRLFQHQQDMSPFNLFQR